MSILYRGPSIDASYQVSYHLAKWFQKKSCFRNRPIRNKDYLKKSSPLKPLCQMNQNLVGNIYGRFSINIAHFVLIGKQTWPPQAILVSD
jgi:hypothetical protein